MKWIFHAPAVASTLLAAFVVMALSAVTVGSGPKPAAAKPKGIPLEQFHFQMGWGSRHPQVLEIDRYIDGRAVISSKQGLADIGQYRYLAFDLSPARLTEDLPLFFLRDQDSGKLRRITLEENELDYIDLSRSSYWKGERSEFGFMLP